MQTTLTDGRVIVRPYTSRDLDATFAAVRESIDAVARWLPWCHAGYGRDEAAVWIAKCVRDWAAGENREFGVFDAATRAYCGGVGLNTFNADNNFANLGYWVRASCRGHGIATAAARLATRFGFRTLGLARLEVVVHVDNAASRRVAEKIPAVFEGIARSRLVLHGGSHDAAVYSLIPADFA
jgi:ribosomal-protein-serine acetyltransferase